MVIPERYCRSLWYGIRVLMILQIQIVCFVLDHVKGEHSCGEIDGNCACQKQYISPKKAQVNFQDFQGS